MVSLTTEYVLMNFIVHFHPLQAVKVSEFLRTPLFYSFFSCLMKIYQNKFTLNWNIMSWRHWHTMQFPTLHAHEKNVQKSFSNILETILQFFGGKKPCRDVFLHWFMKKIYNQTNQNNIMLLYVMCKINSYYFQPKQSCLQRFSKTFKLILL